VIAGVLSTSPRMQSASFSTHADRRSPPCFLGARVPLVSCCSAQRTALAALTLNQAATCRRDIPCPIASTTRCRRSTESAQAMHAGLLTSTPLQPQTKTDEKASCPSSFGKCSRKGSSHCSKSTRQPESCSAMAPLPIATMQEKPLLRQPVPVKVPK
jgi:hypothetical protein